MLHFSACVLYFINDVWYSVLSPMDSVGYSAIFRCFEYV